MSKETKTKLDEILSDIDTKFESDHLRRIQEFIRQPSVSATGEGVLQAANLVKAEMQAIGATNVHLVPPDDDEFGHPQVYGEIIEDAALPTMLLYSMYDVQPVNPEEWIVEGRQLQPFGAEICSYEWVPGYRGRCVVSRGAMNQKGPTQAVFNVLRTIRERGKLPCNIIFAIEGEEELGSVHIERFIDRYRDKLRRADFVYFPFFSERYDGVATMFLGIKGIIPLKILIEGGDWGGPADRDIHSYSGGIVQNPVLKIAQLLTSLKDDDTGAILVPGVANDPDIVKVSDEDQSLLEQLAANTPWGDFKKFLGIRSFRKIDGKELHGPKLFIEEQFKPGLSVNGISSGYVGEGMKTIIPRAAAANVDIRLPPFQKPEKVRELYRRYIQSKWPMAKLNFGQGYPSAKVSVSDPYVQAMISAMQSLGKHVLPMPIIAGSAPFALFQAKLGLPFVMSGLGHGGRQHSANEYIVLNSDSGKIGGVKQFELCLARFLFTIPSRPRSLPAPGDDRSVLLNDAVNSGCN